MDHTLTRPSDGAFTRRIRAYIRRPWGREAEGRNLLTGAPLPVGPTEAFVAFMNGAAAGSSAPAAEPEPEPIPSKTRPAGLARPMPPAVRPQPKPRRRRGLLGLLERVRVTLRVRADRWRRRHVEGAAGSRRRGWGGAA